MHQTVEWKLGNENDREAEDSGDPQVHLPHVVASHLN